MSEYKKKHKRTYARETILEYITKYITDDYNETSDWININSVFADDKKHRMGFKISENLVNDFKTSQTWCLEEFIAEYENMTVEEAERKLFTLHLKYIQNGGDIKPPAPPKIIDAIELSAITSYPEMKSFDKHVLRNKVGSRAWRYLLGRGIGPDHINKYGLKYCDSTTCWVCDGSKVYEGKKCDTCYGTGKNFYYNRLMIPTYEYGKLVYYQGRDLSGKAKTRYKNPKLPRAQVVYYYDLLKEADTIYITEGPIDAMTLFDYSVTATLNMSISYQQILKLMWKKPKRLIFVPDYDPDPIKLKLAEKALQSNIKKTAKITDGKVEIGVYEWNKKYPGFKDINAAGVTEVDEEYIKIVDGSFKNKMLAKLYS